MARKHKETVVTIKDKDLNLLIEIEYFLDTNFPEGSKGKNLAWELYSLSENIIIQRNRQNKENVL